MGVLGGGGRSAEAAEGWEGGAGRPWGIPPPRSSPPRSYSETSLRATDGPSPSLPPPPAPAHRGRLLSPPPAPRRPGPAVTPPPPPPTPPPPGPREGPVRREAKQKKRRCDGAGGVGVSARSGLVCFVNAGPFAPGSDGPSRPGIHPGGGGGGGAHFTFWKTWMHTSSSAVMRWGKGGGGGQREVEAGSLTSLHPPPACLAGHMLLHPLPDSPPNPPLKAPSGQAAGQGRAIALVELR